MACPTGGRVFVFRPGLRHRGHNVVVVGAHQVADNVVVQLQHLFGIGNMGGLGAVEGQCLELLGAKQLAQAAAAAVVLGHHAAEVYQVFTRRADGNNVDALHGFTVDLRGCIVGAFAPQVGGIAEFNGIIIDVYINGSGAFALYDHGIQAAGFHHNACIAAHVRIHDGIELGEGRQKADGGAAGAGGAGAGVGANGENKLAFGRGRLGLHGNLIIDDAGSHALAADIFLIFFTAFNGSSPGGQIDAQHFAGPSIHGHILLLLWSANVRSNYSAAATSSQGIMRSALVGQPATQAPQLMHLEDFLVSGLIRGICQGQALAQAPQPTHFS